MFIIFIMFIKLFCCFFLIGSPKTCILIKFTVRVTTAMIICNQIETPLINFLKVWLNYLANNSSPNLNLGYPSKKGYSCLVFFSLTFFLFQACSSLCTFLCCSLTNILIFILVDVAQNWVRSQRYVVFQSSFS